MNKTEKVCVAMSVFNCENTVYSSIASIIEQTFKNWILEIIDDASTDRTSDIVASFNDPRIFLTRGKHRKGLAARMNEILERTTTCSYFARMDGDDIAFPERFERQVDYLKARPDVDLVGTGIVLINIENQLIAQKLYPESHADICRNYHKRFEMVHPTFMAKNQWIQRYRYDEAYKKSQDFELLSRAYATSTFANVQIPLLAYRVTPLKVKTIIRSRMNSIKIVLVNHRKKLGTIRVARVILEHFGKAVLSTILIMVKYNPYLLKKRSPIDDDLTKTWKTFMMTITKHRYGN